MSHKENVNGAEGYLRVELHAITADRLRAAGDLGTWREPIHGTSVLVDAKGQVLGRVRTLGIQLPKPQRRYSLQIKGVIFVRIQPLISKTKPIRSEIAPYDSMKAAQAAGSTLIKRMIDGECDHLS
jgi:hypothetical protein